LSLDCGQKNRERERTKIRKTSPKHTPRTTKTKAPIGTRQKGERKERPRQKGWLFHFWGFGHETTQRKKDRKMGESRRISRI